MNKYLIRIGWKNVYGEWDKKEIRLDLIILSVVFGGAIIASYIF